MTIDVSRSISWWNISNVSIKILCVRRIPSNVQRTTNFADANKSGDYEYCTFLHMIFAWFPVVVIQVCKSAARNSTIASHLCCFDTNRESDYAFKLCYWAFTTTALKWKLLSTYSFFCEQIAYQPIIFMHQTIKYTYYCIFILFSGRKRVKSSEQSEGGIEVEEIQMKGSEKERCRRRKTMIKQW